MPMPTRTMRSFWKLLHRLVEAPVHRCPAPGRRSTQTSSSTSSAVSEHRQPCLSSFLATVKPSVPAGIEEHRQPVAVVGVRLRAARIVRSPYTAFVMKVLVPVMRQPSPSGDGGGPQAGDVGTGVGLADPDRQDRVAGEHAGHPLRELLGARARVDRDAGRAMSVWTRTVASNPPNVDAPSASENTADAIMPSPRPPCSSGTRRPNIPSCPIWRSTSRGTLPSSSHCSALGVTLGADEVDGLVVDRLEFVGHVDVAKGHGSNGTEAALRAATATRRRRH